MDNQQDEFAELAYSVGFFLGDGTLYCAKSRGSYQVRFEKPDLECLQKVSGQMAKVFGNGGNISSRQRPSWRTGKMGVEVHQLIVCSRDAHDWLASATLMRRVVPSEYFSMPVGVQKEVLAGLMDADGSAEVSKLGYVTIRFTNCELPLIDGVRGLAESIGIPCGEVVPDLRHKRVNYRMTLNTRSFAEKMYFCSERKNARLQAYRKKDVCR